MNKQRLVIHLALAKGGKCVGTLVEVNGQFIPFYGRCRVMWDYWLKRSTSAWLELNHSTIHSVKAWKQREHREYRAIRFQRVVLVGGAA